MKELKVCILEKEKVEHLSGSGCRKVLFCIYVFFFIIVLEKFFFCNIVLTWKIVGALEASVIYIYIYI